MTHILLLLLLLRELAGPTPTPPGEAAPPSTETPAPTPTPTPTPTSAPAPDPILLRCEADWPGDYRMQEHCIRQQVEAATELSAWLRAHDVPGGLGVAIGRCVQDWSDEFGADYRMLWYCADKQIRSYEALHGTVPAVRP